MGTPPSLAFCGPPSFFFGGSEHSPIPSELGLGAEKFGRQFCFHPFSALSAMIRGAADGSRFQVWDYEEEEVEAMLDRYFEAGPAEQVAVSRDPTATFLP